MTRLSNNSFLVTVQRVLLLLIIVTGSISNLRIGLTRMMIIQQSFGVLLYEILIISFICLTIILNSRKLVLFIKKTKRRFLLAYLMMYISVIVIHLLRSTNIIYAYFGSGQLRVVLLSILLLLSLLLEKNKEKILVTLYFSIILALVINVIKSVTVHLHITENIYIYTPRFDFVERISGFLNAPSSFGILGVLSVIIVDIGGLKLNKINKYIVILISFMSLIYSGSYTSILSMLIYLFIKMLKNTSSINKILFAITSSIFIISFLYFGVSIIQENSERIDSINSTFNVFLNSYFIGIPWGEFNKYLGDYTAIFPHNWILTMMAFGGMIGLISIIYIYYNVGISCLQLTKRSKYGEDEITVNYMLFIILFSALFEQTYILVPIILIMNILFATYISGFKNSRAN